MTSHLRISRQVAAGVVLVTLMAVTAAVALGLSHPQPVSSGELGPDWQCTRLAFVFTSCSRVVHLKTAVAEEEGKGPTCPRPTLWPRAAGLLR